MRFCQLAFSVIDMLCYAAAVVVLRCSFSILLHFTFFNIVAYVCSSVVFSRLPLLIQICMSLYRFVCTVLC